MTSERKIMAQQKVSVFLKVLFRARADGAMRNSATNKIIICHLYTAVLCRTYYGKCFIKMLLKCCTEEVIFIIKRKQSSRTLCLCMTKVNKLPK